MENYMIWVWLGVFLLTFIIEAATADLLSIWFTLGSVVAMILSLIEGIPYYIEIVVFSSVSLILLIATRPFVKKITKNSERKTNVDDFIGKVTRLLEDLSQDKKSTIKINDVIYSACLSINDNDTLSKDTKVQIIAVSGNKVIVKRYRDEDVINF